jgi:hypothetical protein
MSWRTRAKSTAINCVITLNVHVTPHQYIVIIMQSQRLWLNMWGIRTYCDGYFLSLYSFEYHSWHVVIIGLPGYGHDTQRAPMNTSQAAQTLF